MSLSPVAFIAPNYRDFKGQWVKFYEPGTTTTKTIYTDSAATIPAAKLQLNADGFIVSAGGAIVVPYVAGAYDAYVFDTEAEADANNTIGATRIADNIASASSESVSIFDNVEEMKASVGLGVGDVAMCKRYYTDGDLVGGLIYEVQPAGTVPDGYVDHGISNGAVAKLTATQEVRATQAGVKTGVSGNLAESLVAANARGVAKYVVDIECDLESTVALSRAMLIEGLYNDGTGATSTSQPKIHVTTTDDCFVFNGSDSVNAGTGGGIRNLTIKSGFGTGSSVGGTVVTFTGSSLDNRAGFARVEDLNIEVSSANDDFAWGVKIDGSSVGGSDGIRDFWIKACRIVSRGNAIGSIQINNAFNVYIDNVECNLENAKIDITGSASNESAGVYITNTTAGTLSLDYCSFVNINGGSFTNFQTTANANQVIGSGVFTSNFLPLLGGAVSLSGFSTANNRNFTASSGASPQFFGKDASAGDSTDLVAVFIGNLLSSQGVAALSYTNALPTGSPRSKYAFTPRKNDDTGAIESASIEFQKIPGSDNSNIILTNSDGAVVECLAGAGVRVGQGAWNDRPLLLGSYRLWVDALGNLRIKGGTPVSDTDGVAVGTQV